MQAEEIERVHRQFCKFTLGVPKQLLTWHVGDFGQSSFIDTTDGEVLANSYWMLGYPTLVREVYVLAQNNCTRAILNNTSYSYVWTHSECVEPGKLIYEIEQQLIDQFVR